MFEHRLDEEIIAGLKAALANERGASRRFIELLVEFARRRLEEKSPHATLFAYCTRELGLSEGDAYRRIRVMEAARKYPRVLTMIQQGQLHLSAVAVLTPHLTPENHKRVLKKARGLSKRALEALVATLPTYAGPGRCRDMIVLLPSAPSAPSAPWAPSAPAAQAASAGPAAPPAASATAPSSGSSGSAAAAPERQAANADGALRGVSSAAAASSGSSHPAAFGGSAGGGPSFPPGPERVPGAQSSAGGPAGGVPAAESVPGDTPKPPPAARISFTADHELLQELARAKEVLSHKYPGNELGPLFKEALKALLEKSDLARQRSERKRAVLPGRRKVPKWVRRIVAKRDGGRCAFTAADGRRCQERSWLEYDHVVPFALGGRSDDPANVRLLCRAHNQQAARAIFGDRAGRPSSTAPPN